MPRNFLHGKAPPLLLLAALFAFGCSVTPPIRSIDITNQSESTVDIDLQGKRRESSVHASLKPGSSVLITGEFTSGEIRARDRVLSRIKPFESKYTIHGTAEQPTAQLEDHIQRLD